MTGNPPRIALQRCCSCGFILRRCDLCGTEIVLHGIDWAAVKVPGELGLKIVCWICHSGLIGLGRDWETYERWRAERET